MRVLKLHHPTGHPYWNQGEFKVQLPNGKFLVPTDFIGEAFGGYRIYLDSQGVWIQKCASGSGYGKRDMKHVPPKLMVPVNQYDKIEYVGKELVMSATLQRDITDNF